MPITVNGQTYYRTAEVCRIVGITKNTFYRWVREGLFPDVEARDRRGWRLFTKDELDRVKAEANRISKTSQSKTRKGST